MINENIKHGINCTKQRRDCENHNEIPLFVFFFKAKHPVDKMNTLQLILEYYGGDVMFETKVRNFQN